jgi:hypothetical protein
VTEPSGDESASTDLVLVPTMSRSLLALDVGIDVAAGLTRRGAAVVRSGVRLGRPVAGLMLRPPLLGSRRWPQTRLLAMAERGRRLRDEGGQQADALLTYLVPVILDVVLSRVDLTELVLDRVDLERVVDSIDIDAIAARIDLDALVDRIPIDRVIERVDIDSVIATVDLDRVVDRIDVDAIAAKIDVTALVSTLDLTGIAREVIEGVDLPEIIRESSGVMASETVVGVRMRGIEADERISRIVDRVMLRRRGRDAAETPDGAGPDGGD